MLKPLRHIIAPLLIAIGFVGCDQLRLTEPSSIAIEQVSPDTVRADKPTTLTITGTGFEKGHEVRFGFKKREREIDTVKPTNYINSNTLEVVTPVLPGLDERAKVWVSVGQPYDESDPIAVTFRPPNIIDLYGLHALGVVGGVAAVTAVLLMIRRGYRRMALRSAVLEAKGRRLALREERHVKATLAQLAAEKKAEQAKLEAEYLPYADQASGTDADA